MQPDFFRHDFLSSLSSDHLKGSLELYEEWLRFRNEHKAIVDHHESYIEALALLKAFTEHRHLPLGQIPPMSPNKQENVNNAVSLWHSFGETAKAQKLKLDASSLLADKAEQYTSLFSNAPAYEFSDTDFARVQTLINELRELINKSNLITDDHKRRLLRRLEAMQCEIHKKTSDIDRFWGFIGEAGITVRKFGEDMKPISDRVTELGRIIIGVILSKEGIKALPEISKLLQIGQ